jgi:ribose 1,5-bisphosphokinase
MPGKLFYLMGASGAGKDSLLRGCRTRTKAFSLPLLIAHRYITREPDGVGENHVWLSEVEFEQRVALGAFAMYWQANGYRYGIGREVDQWLLQGSQVLMNGSRAYLEQARARYGQTLVPVLVKVAPERLRRRLVQRGRETAAEIDARIARARDLEQRIPEDSVVVENDGAIEEAVACLLDAVRKIHQVSLHEEG